MSSQPPSGSNSNMPLGAQQIRFEDINDEYIAQLLSGYWPQPQNASIGTSQNMDIPIPFSQTTRNASASSYQPSHDTSTLPAPSAIVPSQGYHQATFDELMRQIDRERELDLVPQPNDAALSIQTTPLQRLRQDQWSDNLFLKGFSLLTNFYSSSFGQVPGSSSQLHAFQGQPIETTGSRLFPSTIVPDMSIFRLQ